MLRGQKKLGTNIKNIDKQYSNLLSRNAIASIINATKSMDIKKIPQRFKEIKYILSDKDLNHELSKIRLKDLSFARKTIILLIKYNMTYMLFALSYIYNVARG